MLVLKQVNKPTEGGCFEAKQCNWYNIITIQCKILVATHSVVAIFDSSKGMVLSGKCFLKHWSADLNSSIL